LSFPFLFVKGQVTLIYFDFLGVDEDKNMAIYKDNKHKGHHIKDSTDKLKIIDDC